MVIRSRTQLLVVLAGALMACSKSTPKAAQGSAKSSAPVAKTAPAAQAVDDGAGEGRLDPNDPKHGTRKLMGLDTPVYVDGVERAVFRYGDMADLPAQVLEGGSKRYRLYDYFKSIGVVPESIKSIHIAGNQGRIASVEGRELLADKDRFKFQFISGETGVPITRWDTEGLKNDFVVHEIRRMTVYVNKPSAKIDMRHQCHVDAKGACTKDIPYAKKAPAKGTRIYVDGKMVGFVKRREIGDELALGKTKDGVHQFSVDKLIASKAGRLSNVKSVELVAGDDVVARASGSEWATLSPSVYFTLPRHMHGKVRVHVPAAIQATDVTHSDRDALISAVHVYVHTSPATRPLVAISEDTDLSVQLASNTAQSLGRGER